MADRRVKAGVESGGRAPCDTAKRANAIAASATARRRRRLGEE
jgi:hypothetical protein